MNLLKSSSDFSAIKEILQKKRYVAFFDSIFPLWDIAETAILFDTFKTYNADYGYGENLPPGLAPVFFAPGVFEAQQLAGIKEEDLAIPMKSLIERNINKFHAEIHFAMPDLRLHRLDFSCLNSRSLVKTHRLLNLKNTPLRVYTQLENYVMKENDWLMSKPSYIELELISQCEFKCDFCPRQFTNVQSSAIEEIHIEAIETFLNSSYSDTTICLGGLGEPLQHKDVLKIMQRLLSNKNLKNLILETNGLYLDKIFSLVDHGDFSKFTLIININSLKSYATMHGTGEAEKERVLSNLDEWVKNVNEKEPSLLKNIHMQTLKMIENEEEIDELVNFADEKGIVFLFQKYNRYIDLMPERRVSDMTPLERSFCWHLRRDIFIRANGEISFCKQDYNNNFSRGNLATSPLSEIFLSQAADFKKSFGDPPELQMNCRSCDEYFTFNM